MSRVRRRRPDDETASAVVVGAEALLGEAVLLDWIDAISVAHAPVRGATDVALADLADAVRSTAESQRALLPARPLADGDPAPGPQAGGRSLVGHMLEPQPVEAPDYPGRDDLFVATTTALELWKGAHSGRPFSSARFSRHGETFCYVKIEGAEGLDPAGFADRAAIEDALDDALTRDRLGCVYGGGTGLRYSYVDLALLEVERAIPAIRAALQAGRIPRRTWLQFFDADLASEWVGVWPDSPPSPGFEQGPPGVPASPAA